MTRALTFRAILALCLLSPCFGEAEDFVIRFIGNEAFEITDGKRTLLTDFPYRSGYSGYMKYDFAKVQPKGEVLCLITHGHPDHFELPLFQSTEWRIFAPPDVSVKIDPSRIVSNATDFDFGGIRVQAIETSHARLHHYSYLVIWNGKRFYFVGDTESPEALLNAKGLDIAFVTPWLLDALQKTGKRVDAKRIIIYHQAPEEKVDLCSNCTMLEQGQSFSL